MNKLWIQLTLAFSLVTVSGVAIVALLANRQVSADFRSFVAQSQVQASPNWRRILMCSTSNTTISLHRRSPRVPR